MEIEDKLNDLSLYKVMLQWYSWLSNTTRIKAIYTSDYSNISNLATCSEKGEVKCL